MADNGKTQYFIGVDLGGTKILSGLFDQEFNCVGQMKLSTKAGRGPDEVIERKGGCIPDEFAAKLSNEPGTLSMANTGYGWW